MIEWGYLLKMYTKVFLAIWKILCTICIPVVGDRNFTWMKAPPDRHTLHIPHKRKLAINQWSKPYSPAAKEISRQYKIYKKMPIGLCSWWWHLFSTVWWCRHCYWTLGLLFSPAWVSHFPLNVSSIINDPLYSSNVLWTKFMSNSSIDHCLPWVKAHFSDELHSNARTLNLNRFHKMSTVPLQNNSVSPEVFGRVWWFYSHRHIQKIENWGFQWEVKV
jgi:hypothetical protein